jgi:hypothetical protein
MTSMDVVAVYRDLGFNQEELKVKLRRGENDLPFDPTEDLRIYYMNVYLR